MSSEIKTDKKSNLKVIKILVIIILILVVIIGAVIIQRKEEIIKQSEQGMKEQLLSDTQTLPENTEETLAGTKVQLPQEWYTHSVSYVSTTDGTVIESSVKTSNVYAVSTGNGDLVPVPNGFYYVGGNLDTGVIISDNLEDEYNGIMDKTTFEYTKSLQGNQFVWIPCTENEYTKVTWGSYQDCNFDVMLSTAELLQIKKYGGFYVGRYEAGLANTITESAYAQVHSAANGVYNLTGIPQSKANLAPWNFIDWNKAQANSKLMYNTDEVHSGLITGTQWDVICNKVIEKTELEKADINNSIAWGNYMNNSLEYNGRMARAYISANRYYVNPFGETISGNTGAYSANNGDLLSAGSAKVAERYHIFDIAGNLWEWTEEVSYYGGNTSTQYKVFRGGSFAGIASSYPASSRMGSGTSSYLGMDTGFRVVLYIQ